MKKKLTLASTVVAAFVIGALGATSSPVISAPTGGIQMTPVPGAAASSGEYRVWWNGQCKVFTVPGRIMDVTLSNGKTERGAVSDNAAVDRALGPKNPKLHRPATPAEAQACFGPAMGPPPGPPGWTGPPAPVMDLNEACAPGKKRPPELLCP